MMFRGRTKSRDVVDQVPHLVWRERSRERPRIADQCAAGRIGISEKRVAKKPDGVALEDGAVGTVPANNVGMGLNRTEVGSTGDCRGRIRSGRRR